MMLFETLDPGRDELDTPINQRGLKECVATFNLTIAINICALNKSPPNYKSLLDWKEEA